MSRFVVAALLAGAVCCASPASSQEWARKMFKVHDHDFGVVARGAETEFAFELQNVYKEDIHISGVRASCGCTTPSITKDTLKTWEKGAVVAKFNTRSFLGKKGATITVTIDRPYHAEVQLHVSGHIRGDVVLHPGAVEFGEVNAGESAEQKIKVLYAGKSNWRIEDVRSANPNLEVELNETSRDGNRVNYEMLVRLKDGAEVGYLEEELTIVTSDSHRRHIPLPIKGRIVGSLTVSPASLYLGVVEPGQTVTKKLLVRGQSPFKIVGVNCDDCFKIDAVDDSKSLHVVPVTFTAPDNDGKVVQTIEFVTDQGAKAKCVATATIESVGG